MIMRAVIKLLIMATTITTLHTTAIAQAANKKALLVIDVQENLLNPHSAMHMDSAAIPGFLYNLNRAIHYFEENHLPVIYTVNEWTNPVLNMLTGNVCKKGRKGTGIDKRVCLANDRVYHKSKTSAFSNKDLAGKLREYAVTDLYVTGLFAEYCVKGTAKTAVKNDYKVFILEDAIGSKSNAKKLKAVNYCKSIGSTILQTDQLVGLIAWRY